MPFYEYECQACGVHHEAMQKMSDAPLRKCPACGRQKLVRQMSAPVFRLKGGGWYETDFKSDQESKRNLAGEEKPEAAAAAPAPAPASPKAEAAPLAKGGDSAGGTPAKPAAAAKPTRRTAGPARRPPAKGKAPAKGARRR
jgi:putative FmdB family regulatory protein